MPFRQGYTCTSPFQKHLISIMPERDANKEALREVEKAAGTDPVDGKDLLESDALRRQLDEAKQSLSAPAKPSGKKPA